MNALRGRFSAESGTEGVGLGSCLAVLPCLLGSLANEVDEGAPEGGARRRLAASNHFRDLPGKLRYLIVDANLLIGTINLCSQTRLRVNNGTFH